MCVLVIEGQELRLRATLDRSKETGTHMFKCAAHQVILIASIYSTQHRITPQPMQLI